MACRGVVCPYSCRQWWLFAIQANFNEIRELRRRGSWSFVLQRARDALLYTNLYFQRLTGAPLSPDEEVTPYVLVFLKVGQEDPQLSLGSSWGSPVE